MRTLLTKMFRQPRKSPAPKPLSNLVTLEDRAIPAAFSFAGVNFDTDNIPDSFTFLAPGTYSGAVVSTPPSSATLVGVNFPDQYTTFPPSDALGTYFFGDNGAGEIRALNLPAGNDGTTARSGFEADYTNGRAIPGTGQMVVYESASTIDKPQAFMIQAYDATTATWSSWYYSPESMSQFANYPNDPSGAGAFYVTYNVSDLIPSTDYATKFRIVNMTSQDRMVNADGLGTVIPNDPVSTDTLPAPAFGYSSYTNSYFDPDPLYFGSLGSTATIGTSDILVTISPPSGNAPAGSQITYTVTVANNGPDDASGVGITDTIPGLTGVTYTSTTTGGASGNTASGSGTINDTADMPDGSTIVYTVTGTIPPTTTGNLPFTVNTTLPPGTTSPNPADGSATVNTNAVLQGDLFVTIAPTTASPIAGTTVTFTIVAGNTGPSTATSTLVADVLNSAFTSVSYTSTVTQGTASGNTASGSGNINDALTLAPGSRVTYTVLAKLSPNASGTVTNTASITAPADFTDNDPTNNTATSVLTVIPGSDVVITATGSPTTATVGGKLTYHVVVTNNGPADANGVKVSSLLDANLLNPSYTSSATSGVTGNSPSGFGNLSDTLDIPSGASASYYITGTVNTGISGNLVSTFTSNNPNPDPNTPIDTVTVTTPLQNSTDVIYAASTGQGVPTQVFVFNSNSSQRFSYSPYSSSFTSGVNVAVGDINGDGFPDVVTGAASGGASHVHAVNGFTGANLFSFFAYGSTTRTGVNVAVGDVTAAGQEDIVTGSDTGGAPRIRVFDISAGGADGKSVLDFYAFPSTDRSGVRVTVGDINGDGVDEIIAAEGPGGSPYVKIFNGQTGAFLSEFKPFANSTRGVYIAAGDLNGDGKADIIVGDGSSSSTVRTFNSADNFALLNQFTAYEPSFTGGVRVATYTDDTADPVDPPMRILTGPGVGGGPRLRKFTVTGGDLGSQFLIDSFNRGGIYVG